MTNLEKYNQIFVDNFSISPDQLDEKFVYQCVPEWDSIGHMGMIAGLEDTFSIMLETDDIVDFGSYTKGMEILAKYGVVFN